MFRFFRSLSRFKMYLSVISLPILIPKDYEKLDKGRGFCEIKPHLKDPDHRPLFLIKYHDLYLEKSIKQITHTYHFQ